MTKLKDAHVIAVCHFGEGQKCCAYLAMGGEFVCLKEDAGLAQIIKRKLDLGESNAKGDNCSGPPNYTLPTLS